MTIETPEDTAARLRAERAESSAQRAFVDQHRTHAGECNCGAEFMGTSSHHPDCYINLPVTGPVIRTNVDPSADPNVIELPSAIDPSSPLGIVEKELTDLGSLPDTPYVLRPALTFSTFSYLADLLHGILDYLPSVFGPDDHASPAYHEHPVRRILYRLGSYYSYGFIPPPDRDPAPPLVPLTQSEALYLLDLVRATYTLSREFRRLDVPYDQRASIR